MLLDLERCSEPFQAFMEANPMAEYAFVDIAFNGFIYPVFALSSLTNVDDIHATNDEYPHNNIQCFELGNTGEYVFIDYTA